jgi:hypothetical protein
MSRTGLPAQTLKQRCGPKMKKPPRGGKSSGGSLTMGRYAARDRFSSTAPRQLRRANFALPPAWFAILGGDRGQVVFIVQAKPREPEGIIKVTKDTREEALEAAKDFLNQGMPFVTIVADGRVYTAEEFALTVIDGP